MPKFKCTNSKCSDYNKEVAVYKVKMIMSDGEIMCKEYECPTCGAIRESIDEPGFTTTMLGGQNICRK